MTVIAYSAKHKMMAADSRLADVDNTHVTHCQKIFRLANGALLGTAGAGDDRAVRTLLSTSTPKRLPTAARLAQTKCDFDGILVFPSGEIFMVTVGKSPGEQIEWNGQVVSISDSVIAVGSGGKFAYGAMDCGKSPKDAVRAACKRDLNCALPVQWENL